MPSNSFLSMKNVIEMLRNFLCLLIYLMYLISALAIRGAAMNSLFMHDKSPVMNFLFRFNRLLIFALFVSSTAVPFDDVNLVPAPAESANVEITR